jgi:molybdenum cofactor biosynthesis enzyme MoaA
MPRDEPEAASVVDGDGRLRTHEDAAHETRNWVRLTFTCNNRCVFCLDSRNHDGAMRDREDVRRQMVDGRRSGATRLILSGGEPTMHPGFVDFIRLGRRLGYRKVQTVTNGRLFSYPSFLERCLDAGLDEITFSVHGPNAKVHDALVGVKGAFEDEMRGLRAALADGRPIVNIDVVVNRGNVRHLPEMLRTFTALGVHEFDLLQIVPFGRAFDEGKERLFYDLVEMRPYLQETLAYSTRPDIHLWMNRFPPQHLEGHEHLIQDPHKLEDEVRGRKEEFARLVNDGVWLDCRDPSRCKCCYLEQLCDTLESTLAMVDGRAFDVVRVDTGWEARQPSVFGGDPASAARARGERSLPVLPAGPAPDGRAAVSLELLADAARATTLVIVAPTLGRAVVELSRFPGLRRIELDLEDYAGLAEAMLPGGLLAGRTVARVTARNAADAAAALAVDGEFEVTVELSRDTRDWLLALPQPSPRIALRQPTYERLSEAAARDIDLAAFFSRFPHQVPVEGVPACISGRAPRPRRRVLDTAMMAPDGKIEVFRYVRRHVLDGYLTKSLRCRECRHDAACPGMHINYVRSHGYRVMVPVTTASDVSTVTPEAQEPLVARAGPDVTTLERR